MTALLILGPFMCVWAIAVIFYYMGRRRANQVRLAEISFSQSVQNRFTSTFINRPKTWLTVKSRNSEDVARSIGLIDLQSCASSIDLSTADPDIFFVSPPINGWVVVIGERLPDPDTDIDECFKFLSEMSERLGHVQYFHGNQALGHHAWVKFIERQVVRAYVWIGETAWNQGSATLAEKKSGMTAFDYFEDDCDGYRNWEKVRQNIEQLPLLASIWSIDPVVLLDRSVRVKPGLIGRFPIKRKEKN